MHESAERGVLKWFGHMKGMREERISKMVCMSEGGNKEKGRPRRWNDGVKDTLRVQGLNMQEGVRHTRDIG